MSFVSIEELEVNFSHGTSFQDGMLYPFGVCDEQVVLYTSPTIVENLFDGYATISSNSKLGRHLREIAKTYQCSDITDMGKIFIPCPSRQFPSISIVENLQIYFVGILSTNQKKELLIKFV